VDALVVIRNLVDAENLALNLRLVKVKEYQLKSI
jgi:hypothetical protein